MVEQSRAAQFDLRGAMCVVCVAPLERAGKDGSMIGAEKMIGDAVSRSTFDQVRWQRKGCFTPTNGQLAFSPEAALASQWSSFCGDR